jgi:hypothetical protein
MSFVWLVNHVSIEEKKITVGATTEERWRWELEEGCDHGGYAFTMVFVCLADNGPRRVVSETAGLHAGRQAPERASALRSIGPLLDLAWQIYEAKLDETAARQRFMGHRLPGIGR